jgi:hypothetical protein
MPAEKKMEKKGFNYRGRRERRGEKREVSAASARSVVKKFFACGAER